MKQTSEKRLTLLEKERRLLAEYYEINKEAGVEELEKIKASH